jgi:hypothetical protein
LMLWSVETTDIFLLKTPDKTGGTHHRYTAIHAAAGAAALARAMV